MPATTPKDIWKDYELIDSGDSKKLERFGQMVLSRPEPQALWNPSLSAEEWHQLAHATFVKGKSGETGEWKIKSGIKDRWNIQYQYKEMNLQFRLGLTAFKHVGIFPEQADNWNFIYDQLTNSKIEKPRVLNLFAYTGGASLVAKFAGADVAHVDSVKPVISWAKENMELSGLSDIRWVVEDAMKFVKREVKRGSVYQGIILDPPAYGRGPEGEKWVMEERINELMYLCSDLLVAENSFLIANLYSMGLSALIMENLATDFFGGIKELQSGELFFPDHAGRKLPLGTFVRFTR